MADRISLESLGWDTTLESHIPEGHAPGRVVAQRSMYGVMTAGGELLATPSGKLKHEASSAADLPIVGDWVAVLARPDEGSATIHAVLPRRTKLSRKQAGHRSDEQVLAANVDTVFVVMALGGGVRPRGLDRYLTMAWDGGVEPVVVLSKADLSPDPHGEAEQLVRPADEVPVHITSAVARIGLEELDTYLRRGRTVAIVGPSGAGKSTLVNTIAGDKLFETQQIRRTGHRGRHTTVHRELVTLPGGAMIIDTPGLRELQLWESPALAQTFEDIESLGASCRFSDCAHEHEPGCAVLAALEEGTLTTERLEHYRSLEREVEELEQRQRHRADTPKRRPKPPRSSRRRDKEEW